MEIRGNLAYIFSELAFSSTSFGISASGVLEVGGVLNIEGGGGKPGGRRLAKELNGKEGVLVEVAPPRIPAALRLASKELVSGTGVEDVEGGICGGDRRDCA